MIDDQARPPELLASLAIELAPHPENVATEALKHVLRKSPPVTRAFEDYLRQAADLPTGLHYITQSGDDGSIPDLVGIASDGSRPLLVEAKFWAVLTDHQPVRYLERLPVDRPAMLLFVVPSVRVEAVWGELLTRVVAAGLAPTGEQGPGMYRRVLARGQQVLAVTSWRALLAELFASADVAGDHLARADVDQLRGLCELMDSEAFAPLTSDDLSESVAVRLLHYDYIIKQAFDRMSRTGVVSTKTSQGNSLNSSAGAGWWGRYFALGNVTCSLRVDVGMWARRRATPIWLQVGYRGEPPVAALAEAIRPLRDQRNRVVERDYYIDVAIDLPLNVDVGAVVDSIVQQVGVVANYLKSLDYTV